MRPRSQTTQPYVFISYARSDIEQVRAVVDALCEEGVRCWIDERQIAGGANWGGSIADAINGCSALLLLSSAASLASRNVKQEIALAWQHEKPCLPLLLDPTPAPNDVAYWLATAQWIEVLDQPRKIWLSKVVEALAQLIQPRTVTAASLVDPTLGADASTTPSTPGNLPTTSTSFVGRKREIADILSLIASGRLITLSGVGGSGKSRLALELGYRLRKQFRDGVWFVELAHLRDGALVPQTIAEAIGVREQSGQSVEAVLYQHLQPREMLLILDNCEHMINASARIAEGLARRCPALKILATSREILKLDGETVYQVPPLSLPGLQSHPDTVSIQQAEAVELFVTRAAASRPGFRITNTNAVTIAEICHRLEGIPLALELAAARLRVLTIEQLGTRLDDRFQLLTAGRRTALPRQQTLRATIDWSFNLLPPMEQTLLTQLAVFAGGCTLESATAICPIADADEITVLQLIAELVDKSLVIADEHDAVVRYRLLEMIRQYAQEQLDQVAEIDALRQRHAEYFLALAEQAESELRGPDQTAWLRQLELEIDNIRAALDWSFGTGSVDTGLRLAGALLRFWELHSYLSEGQRWLEMGLSAGDQVSPPIRAKALYAAGGLISLQGSYERARQLTVEALQLFRQQDDLASCAAALNSLGITSFKQGDYSAARRFYEESLTLRRQQDNPLGIAVVLFNLGLVAEEQGDLRSADAFFTESLALRRKLNDAWGIANTLNSQGNLMLRSGNLTRASALFSESLDRFRALGDKRGIAGALTNLGEIATTQGDVARVTALFEEGFALYQSIGEKRGIGIVLHNHGKLALRQGELARAADYCTQSLSLAWEMDEQGALPDRLETVAAVIASQGNPTEAVRLWAAADARREQLGVARSSLADAVHDEQLDLVRRQLDHRSWSNAWADGRSIPIQDAVMDALGRATSNGLEPDVKT